MRHITGHKAYFLYSCLVLFAFFLPFLTASFAEGAEAVGKISAAEGQVDVLRGGKLPAVPAKAGDALYVGDIVRTKSESKAEVKFHDGNVLRVAQRSRIDVSEYRSGAKGVITLTRGKVEAVVEKKTAQRMALPKGEHRFEIRTPSAVAGVRGTDFFVFQNRNITGVAVKEGSVSVVNPRFPDKPVVVTAGNMTVVAPQTPPQAPRAMTETDMKSHEKDVAPDKKKSDDKQKSDDKKKADAGSSDDKSSGGKSEGKTAEGNGKGDNQKNDKSQDTAKEGGDKSGGEQANGGGTSSGSGSGDSGSSTTSSSSGSSGAGPESSGLATPVSLSTTSGTSEGISSGGTASTGGISADLATGGMDLSGGLLSGPLSPTGSLIPGGTTTSTSTFTQNNNIYTPPITETTAAGIVTDTTAPKVTIVDNPSSVTDQSSAVFSFTSNEAVIFEYRLDNGTWLSTGATLNLAGLSEGGHTIEVRATDLAGNVSSVISFNWTTNYLAGLISGTLLSGFQTAMLSLGLNSSSLPSGWSTESYAVSRTDANGDLIGIIDNDYIYDMIYAPEIKSSNSNEYYSNDSFGVFINSPDFLNLNVKSFFDNRSDSNFRLVELKTAGLAFGLWQLSSAGTFDPSKESNSWAMGTSAYLDFNAPGVIDSILHIFTLGDLWSDSLGLLHGKSDGVFGSINNGKVRILTGDTMGTLDKTLKTFDALSVGTWFDAAMFYDVMTGVGSGDVTISKLADLAFPTVAVGTPVKLSSWAAQAASSAGGSGTLSVDIGDTKKIRFYSRSSTAAPSIWVTNDVTGAYTIASGAVGAGWRVGISDNATAGSASLFGEFTVLGWSANKWIADVEFIGGLSADNKQYSFYGVAAGGYIETTASDGTFSGTAAGLVNPVTALSKINGVQLQEWDGTTNPLVTEGTLYGVMGAVSLWNSDVANKGNNMEFNLVGLHSNIATPANNHIWQMNGVVPYNYTTGTATTTDGGSYWGYLGGYQLQVSGGLTSNGLEALFTGLYLDPNGNIGILSGSNHKDDWYSGRIDSNGYWDADIDIDTAKLGTNSNPSINYTNFTASISNVAAVSVSATGGGTFTINFAITGDPPNDLVRVTANGVTYNANLTPGNYGADSLAYELQKQIQKALDATGARYKVKVWYDFTNNYFVIENDASNPTAITVFDSGSTASEFSYSSHTINPDGTPVNGSAVSLSTSTNNGITVNSASTYQSANITGQPWGIWTSTLVGSTSGTISNTWTLPLDMNTGADVIRHMEVTGYQWSPDGIKGYVKGYWGDIKAADPAATATTGIYVGNIAGVFNANTWQATAMGSWMETTAFLTNACPGGACNTTGSSLTDAQNQLQKLGIPVVEVGRANLTGTYSGMGSLTVNLNNVIFFAPATGQQPSIWAAGAGNVTGSYDSAYSYGGKTVTMTGNGINADLNVNQWSGGKWLGAVSNSVGSPGPYTGTGTMSGITVNQIKGAAAGTYSGGSITSGTAAGTVK